MGCLFTGYAGLGLGLVNPNPNLASIHYNKLHSLIHTSFAVLCLFLFYTYQMTSHPQNANFPFSSRSQKGKAMDIYRLLLALKNACLERKSCTMPCYIPLKHLHFYCSYVYFFYFFFTQAVCLWFVTLKISLILFRTLAVSLWFVTFFIASPKIRYDQVFTADGLTPDRLFRQE